MPDRSFDGIPHNYYRNVQQIKSFDLLKINVSIHNEKCYYRKRGVEK